MRLERACLRAGLFAPMVAVASVLVASAAAPGFNHATRYLSELGTGVVPDPMIFNLGLLFSGALGLLAGPGVAVALRREGSGLAPALLTAVFFMSGAVGLIIAGVYPYPDPRHQGIMLGFGLLLAPLTVLWALSRVRDAGRLKAFLLAAFAAMGLMYLLAWNHLGHFVTSANVGLWERAFTLLLNGWVVVLVGVLERRCQGRAAG